MRVAVSIASEYWRPGDLIGLATVVRDAGAVNVDLNARVAGGVGAREANKVLARAGARAGNIDLRAFLRYTVTIQCLSPILI